MSFAEPRIWMRKLQDFLGGIPEDYLVADLETSHISAPSPTNWISQIGYALTQDRRIVMDGGCCLDWSDNLSQTEMQTYYRDIDKTAWHMRSQGKNGVLTAHAVQRFGEPSRIVLANLHELLSDCLALERHPFVGFNIFGFDCVVLERIFHTYHRPLRIPWGKCLDVGLLEKAMVLGMDPPDRRLGQTLEAWYDQVKRAFCREKWNLSDHCVGKYLADQPIDWGRLHTAPYDCVVTHQVLEQMRVLTES